MKLDRQCTIIENVKLQEDVYKMTLQFDSFEKIKGGQFIHILLNSKEHVLRRPFCICDFDEFQKTITICYAIVGDGTKIMSSMQKGEKLKAMFPLGNGYENLPSFKKVVLLGGGLGCAVLPAIAKIDNEKVDYYAFMGFANKDKVVLENEMQKYVKNIVVATDDGSYKEKGYITDILYDKIDEIKPDAIFCCGPEIIYKILKTKFKEKSIPIFVSLEQRMGCGIGACLVCNCKIQKEGKEQEYLRVCKDGPVFNLEEVCL